MPSVSPGSNYTRSAAMRAPSSAGTCRGYRRMDRDGTARFGGPIRVEVLESCVLCYQVNLSTCGTERAT
ncbi:MAG: hypothetical protein MZW92_02170, partial [Comamonadaceae bacterium]|nr:hypothetical protein [Comamonadaceae bacterium]